jgi:Uma2 family endonuclease
MSVQFARRCFSVDEYYRMAAAGVLTKDDRVELIEGEIIEMSPIGSRHAGCVNRLTALLSRELQSVGMTSVQNPIRIDDFSEPEPELALLKPRDDYYSQNHPTPEDVWLVIEVAETSVEYDRRMKMPLYARAAIPEAWLVNLPADTVEIHTRPLNGKYQQVQKLKRGQTFVTHALPTLELVVDTILG